MHKHEVSLFYSERGSENIPAPFVRLLFDDQAIMLGFCFSHENLELLLKFLNQVGYPCGHKLPFEEAEKVLKEARNRAPWLPEKLTPFDHIAQYFFMAGAEIADEATAAQRELEIVIIPRSAAEPRTPPKPEDCN